MTLDRTSSVIVTPLKALQRWFAASRSTVPASLPQISAQPRPLRVLQVLEPGQPRQLGRMRISGRMADVCAELDRLASNEARCH